MLFTPKSLRDLQTEVISGTLSGGRTEVADDEEPTLTALIGKRKITLYARPARGEKREKLGELAPYGDQREWLRDMRDRARSIKSAARQAKKQPGLPATPAEKLTVEEYLDAYYYKETAGSIGVKEKENNSQKKMRSCFKSMMHMKIGDINRNDIDEWNLSYAQPILSEDGHTVIKFGAKGVTRKRQFSTLAAMFNHAHACRHIKKNPIFDERGRLPVFENDAELPGRPLEKGEITRLKEVVENCETRDRLFIYLLLCTGARPGELMHSRVENIDFSMNRIKVIAAFTKTRKTRYLQFPEFLKKQIKDYIHYEQLGRDGWLFRNIKPGPHCGKRMREFRKPWERICRLAILNNRLYDLRHTFAKTVYMAERDIVTTSKLLGHGDIKTTQNYLSSLGVEMREATEALEKLFL